MTSLILSQADYDKSQSIDNLCLIRYVKPSLIFNGGVTDDIFQLREDRKPPEEYISFYHSTEGEINCKLKQVLSFLSERSFKAKSTSAFIHLEASNACEDINITKNIVEFKVCGYPHYGMFFLTDDDMDVIEAKTILLYYASFHKYADIIS